MRFWSGHASLLEQRDREALLASIAEFQPGLVVVDTLSAATPGGEENGGANLRCARNVQSNSDAKRFGRTPTISGGT